MLVRNLVSWAGHDFSHMPGAIVDLPDDIAEARIIAGLAVLAPNLEPAPEPNAAPDSALKPAPRRRR